jgi:(1->4)-alpha-D-glucan 1-alpha-D-glucosylmutase
MYVLQRALLARREHPSLFRDGAYLPLRAEGERAAHVFAFLRRRGDDAAIAVVPRLVVALGGLDGPPVGTDVWRDTRIPLPSELAHRSVRWRACLSGAECGPGTLQVADLLSTLPAELLTIRLEG